MNYLWAGMILVGVIYASFHGTLPAITNAALDSAKEAVTLCITMMGVMSFWVGMMKIAEHSGIIEGLSRKMRPILRFLFPRLPEGHIAGKYIATNMIANMFGLGWAATPAGLKAMEALADLEKERGTPGFEELQKDKESWDMQERGSNIQGRLLPQERVASDEMCTFLIINISSLQLIPVNIIAYRGQYGSVNPTAIVGPALIATICSTFAAVIFCKVKNMIGNHRI